MCGQTLLFIVIANCAISLPHDKSIIADFAFLYIVRYLLFFTKFDGGLLRLHEADEAAVDWLTTYDS